ncbi:MAG: aminotransferase class I/II-fold pyridoxal phosphate-dependent enzyme [Methanoregulaceae archaeon]|nr:aminotransferase class I/II-fold pyridoxal phosphate-dependent enzyme [Methanoregulaceae archaeon]
MKRLVRRCFDEGGYSYAMRIEEAARRFGSDRVARLSSNENPLPPSDAAVEEGCNSLAGVNRYPDEGVGRFIRALREHYGDYHFVAGVGMDGVIETTIRTLVEPGDRVAVSTPTFSFYGLAAVAQGAEVVSVPRDGTFAVDPGRFARAACGAKLSFLCTPNNPTGNATPIEAVREILESTDGMLFLDNAYVEYSDLDYTKLMDRYDRLIIGRTMSKIFSLAGLRIGYAFVPEWFVPYYRRAATPHTVNSVSAAAAHGAFCDRGRLTGIRTRVAEWRERVIRECRYPTFPSDSNFIMVDVAPRTGDEAVERLADKGVLVRSCKGFSGLADHYIRVSYGEEWENDRFLEAINSI